MNGDGLVSPCIARSVNKDLFRKFPNASPASPSTTRQETCPTNHLPFDLTIDHIFLCTKEIFHREACSDSRYKTYKIRLERVQSWKSFVSFFSWKDRVPYRPTRSNQDDFSADRLATNQQMEWATWTKRARQVKKRRWQPGRRWRPVRKLRRNQLRNPLLRRGK